MKNCGEPHSVIPTKRKPFCHPDRAKRAEGAPSLERVLPWGFLASLEMTGWAGARAATGNVAPLIRRSAEPPDTFSPRRRQGGAVLFRTGAMPRKGLRPLPPHSVIPTERSERRDPQGRTRSPWGISRCRLPIGKEIFRFRLPKRLSDKISEMTVGGGEAATPLLPPFSAEGDQRGKCRSRQARQRGLR